MSETTVGDRLPLPPIIQPLSLPKTLPEALPENSPETLTEPIIQQQIESYTPVIASEPPAAILPAPIAISKLIPENQSPPSQLQPQLQAESQTEIFQTPLTPTSELPSSQLQTKSDLALDILSPQRSILGQQNPIAISSSMLTQSIDSIPPDSISEPNSIPEAVMTQTTKTSITRTPQSELQSDLPTISLAPTQTPNTWSNVADLLRQSATPNLEPSAEKIKQRSPPTEERVSMRMADSSESSENARNNSTPYTLTSLMTALNILSVRQQNQEDSLASEQSLELLAQIVYGLVRDRFSIEKERHSYRAANHPPWIDIISPGFFKSITLTPTANASNSQQSSMGYPPSRQLEALTQEVYKLTQHRLECDRERQGNNY